MRGGVVVTRFPLGAIGAPSRVQTFINWLRLGRLGSYVRGFTIVGAQGPGGSGNVVTATKWDVALSRYVFEAQIITIGASAQYFWRDSESHDIDFALALDPSRAGAPAIYRVRDTLLHRRSAGTGRTRASWLLTTDGQPDATVNNVGGAIGFISEVAQGAAGPTAWRTHFSNNNLSLLRQIVTAADPTVPHELVVEIDGIEKRVNWYIDGVKVDTYKPVVGGLPVPTALTVFYLTYSLNASGPGGPVTASILSAGVGPIITADFAHA